MSAGPETLRDPMHLVGSRELDSSSSILVPELSSKPTNIPQPTSNGSKVNLTNGKVTSSSNRAKDRGHDENAATNNTARDANHDDIQLRPHINTRLYHRADKSKKRNGNGRLVSGRNADFQWERSR